MSYAGLERRRNPRVSGRFVVSYRVLNEAGNADISQTKNISLGGMLLTTNRKFEVGASLALEIRLPFDPNPIMIIARVTGSHEVSKDLIYDTHLSFLAIDENHKRAVKDTVDYYLKKDKLA